MSACHVTRHKVFLPSHQLELEWFLIIVGHSSQKKQQKKKQQQQQQWRHCCAKKNQRKTLRIMAPIFDDVARRAKNIM